MNYENLKTELALIEAANAAVSDTLSKPPKPRGPLLLNLLACSRCGVERRFRIVDGAFRCESCGLTLDEARASGPVPTPPFPPARPTTSSATPDQDARAELLPTSPGQALDLISPGQGVANQHGAGRAESEPFSYGNPMWGDTRPGGGA